MGVISHQIKGGRGYLMVDNRASGGKLEEYATMTCGHCNTIVVLRGDRKRPRGYCKKCHAYVCDNAACVVNCTPILKAVALAQKYPGLPVLTRGYQGQLLCDPKYFQEGKIF